MTLEGGGSKGSGVGWTAVLLEVAKRLKSQPLLLALGLAVVFLVIAATASVEALRALTLPLLVLFVLGAAAWLAKEFLSARERLRRGVSVRATGVGETGRVKGVVGAARGQALPDVAVRAKRVEGEVVGVEYAPDGESDDRRPQ